MVSTVWTPLDLLRSGLAFALPSSVSPPPARFSSPAGIAFAPCSSGCRYQLFPPTHGLGFPLSILRFRLGHFPLAAERRLPSSVLGPVESPPCRRHRPLPYRSFLLQGVPALVLAPHVWPGKVRWGGGGGTSRSSCAVSRLMLAHRSSILLASDLLRTALPCIPPLLFLRSTPLTSR